MKKITVIGNSLTAVKTIEALKAAGEDVQATFISPENTFPYYRHQLSDLPAKKITQTKILYRPAGEYEKDKINFIFDKKITRVNLKRRRITLDDKEQIDCDILLLADLPQAPFFGIKGANKSGLYNLKRLSDVVLFLKAFPILETIVIESNKLSGLKMALAIVSLNAQPPKEVFFLTSGAAVLDEGLTEEEKGVLAAASSSNVLRVMPQTQIVEILGDNEAKAIRLNNGKVYGAQAILTDSDLPDLRLFKETELVFTERVAVNEVYQTNFANVFAIDAVCDRMTSSDWDVLPDYFKSVEEQAAAISAAVHNREPAVSAQ